MINTSSFRLASFSRKLLSVLQIMLFMVAPCFAQPEIEDGYVKNGDQSLYFKTMGSGDPIVVLHGGPGFDHRQFLPFIWELADNHQVILFDQRCTGLSTGPADSMSVTLDTFIDDIEAIRKAFGIERMNLMGHSWGGILAMHYSLRHEARLKSLILCSTTATAESFPEMRATYEENRAPGESEQLDELYQSEEFQSGDPAAYENFWRLYFKPYFDDQSQVEKMDLLFTENTIKNCNTVGGFIFRSLGDFDLHSDLEKLQVPTLIIHGDADPMDIKYGKMIHDRIPESEFVSIENVGHWLFVDGTDSFSRSIIGFLEKQEQP